MSYRDVETAWTVFVCFDPCSSRVINDLSFVTCHLSAWLSFPCGCGTRFRSPDGAVDQISSDIYPVSVVSSNVQRVLGTLVCMVQTCQSMRGGGRHHGPGRSMGWCRERSQSISAVLSLRPPSADEGEQPADFSGCTRTNGPITQALLKTSLSLPCKRNRLLRIRATHAGSACD